MKGPKESVKDVFDAAGNLISAPLNIAAGIVIGEPEEGISSAIENIEDAAGNLGDAIEDFFDF